ncbi:hypothetical protein ACFSLT_03670 [Novosphingobium resinovorum]
MKKALKIIGFAVLVLAVAGLAFLFRPVSWGGNPKPRTRSRSTSSSSAAAS